MQLAVNIDFVRPSNHSFAEALDISAEIGYDLVEPYLSTGYDILAEYDYYHMVSLEEDPRKYGEWMAERGLDCMSFSSHAPLMKPEASVRWLRSSIRWADHLDGAFVNTSEGPKPEFMDEAQAFDIMEYTLTRVLRTAERYDVTVCLEPEFKYTQNPETLERILGLVESDHLAVNYDPGNVYGGGNDPIKFLDTIGPETVGHVHVKDVNEAGDAVAVGDGIVNWDDVFDRLESAGYDGVLSIECANIADTRESYEFMTDMYPDLLE